MMEGVVQKHPQSIYNSSHWLGTFMFNSFVPTWQPMDRWFFLMSRLRQGEYMQGHIGWRQDVADFLRLSRVAHVFIVRDLRDAAVSQTYHILDKDDSKSKHPGKATYRALGGFDEALKAVIIGLGPYPGAIQLFELYARWLDEKAVHVVRFEEAIEDLEGTAAGILSYGLEQITQDVWEAKFVVGQEHFDSTVSVMADLAAQTRLSPTFREGKAGSWKEAFTDEHKDLFKRMDRNNWLVRLGYEKDEDW
jgi:hypothetical protein